MSNLDEFLKDRKEALLTLDKDKITAYCKKYSVTMPPDDKVFWIGIHKAIVHATDLPFEFRQKSYDWLVDRGYNPEVGGKR